jgi:hypothetical protein
MELFNYYFHYNGHTGLWAAIPRDFVREYWNGDSQDKFIYSESIDTLIKAVKQKEKKK